MAGFNQKNDDDLISEINITPLVDVFLVILVIFLVSAPVIYQSAIKVQLPTAATGEDSKQDAPLQFSVSKEGTIHWGKEALSWEGLSQKLSAKQELAKETAVIHADTQAEHGSVIKLMDMLRKHGLTKFAMSVAQVSKD